MGKPLGKLGLDGSIILKIYLQESGRGLNRIDVTGKGINRGVSRTGQ